MSRKIDAWRNTAGDEVFIVGIERRHIGTYVIYRRIDCRHDYMMPRDQFYRDFRKVERSEEPVNES